jgi:hypothetical protein
MIQTIRLYSSFSDPSSSIGADDGSNTAPNAKDAVQMNTPSGIPWG